MQDWNDLRLVLAVQRAGSLAGAAQALGVDHSTAFRRLKALEERTRGCSAKISRGQTSLLHRNRRTVGAIRTRRPWAGRSERNRT